ncbi:hypothetical protein RhiirA5_419011 [Rhizophagus irregularis]|uniref:Uncharacterized protein n=1 Tax=Rhizophagus irregularis TaxID=588596 RepID=A0A2N0PJ43_9GLOM|nr:hypothetical protein RhiirA5_419011 [Rhizophagus irregularis]
MEGRHFPRRRNEKLIAINTKIYVNIRERPVETKEVHCTTAYERKSVNFQWTVTREMEKDFFYVSNEEIGNAIERSLKFEGLEEAWIISQKKKSFNNNSLEKIKLIFEPPSNNVSLNEEVLKNKAKDCYENDKEG